MKSKIDNKRFEYIEIKEDNCIGLTPIITQRIIPEDQNLSYFDLVSICPTYTTLNLLSRNLILKYKVIPLAVINSGMKLKLPKNLKSEFHTVLLNDGDQMLYIATVNSMDSHVINIIRNATGYSITAIPLKEETFNRFIKNNYFNILQEKDKIRNKCKKNVTTKFKFSLIEKLFYKISS